MYARKYYIIIYRRKLLLIYRRNLLPEYSRTSQQQYSPRSPFTSFTIHFFTFTFSPFSLHFLSFSFPFPLLSPPPFIPLYLTTSGTKTEKNRDNSFVSRKNVLTLQP